MRHASDDRVFAGALAASLALHAALLAGLRFPPPQPAPEAPEGAILVTRLMQAAGPSEPEARQEQPQSAPPAPKKEKRAALPKQAAPSVSAPAEPSPPAAASAAAEPSPPAGPAPAPAPAPSAPRQMAGSAPVGSTVDPNLSIARYRQQLIALAARYKRYPPQAVDEGWEGNVVVRISVAPGAAPQIALKAGSGRDVLDAQALAMFRSAVPQVPVPPALAGQSFAVEVPVLYSLKD